MSGYSGRRGDNRFDQVKRLIADRKWAEAEELLGSLKPVVLDSHEARAYLARVQYWLREYESLVTTGETYLLQPDYELISLDPKQHAETLGYIGIGLTETGETARALSCLEESLRFDPTNQQTYLALARLFACHGDQDQARRWIDRGVDDCAESAELRMLRDILAERPTISACMIVKDEEDLLAGCLESIRDWVDEIVLVDTGSTDRTIDIAKEYGARIFEYEWHDDFSAARNYSLEQATSDWILIIDADERFVADDIPTVVDSLRANESNLLSVNIINEYDNSERTTFSNSVRLFRRELNLLYRGIVHNALDIPDKEPVLRSTARIRHLGYGLDQNKMRQKFERTLYLLKRQLEANPDDTFALFNYAELIRGARPEIRPEDAEEVIRAASRVVELTESNDPEKSHLHLMALNQLAATYLAQSEVEKAEIACRASLSLRPDYLDGLMYLGFILYRLGKHRDAIEAFKTYLVVQSRFDGTGENHPIILSYPASADLAHNNLGILYELTGDLSQAKEHYRAALEIRPGFRQAATHLGRLYLAEGNLGEAEHFFRLQLEFSADFIEPLSGLGDICFRTGRYPEAIDYYQYIIDAKSATSETWNDLGNCYFKLSDLERAADCYRRSARISPTTPVTFRNLGITLARLGRSEEALEWLQKYLDLESTDLEVRRLTGNLLLQTGSSESAIPLFEAILAEVSGDIAATVGLADCYHNAGQLDKALRLYQEALRLRPELDPVRKRIEEIQTAAQID